MPTPSVVPLLLTVPNFLATQVAPQVHNPLLHLLLFHSSLVTQVAPRSHTYNGTNITLHVLQVGCRWLIGWLVGLLAGWLVSWMVGWFVSWLVG